MTAEQTERIRDFVAALRSGEYKQTHWKLAREHDDGTKSYCCEGVAYERYHAQFEGFTLEWDLYNQGEMCMVAKHGEYVGFNVAGVAFWEQMGMLIEGRNTLTLELPYGLNIIGHGDNLVEYASLNDDGLTFEQIADLITWQFLGGMEKQGE